MACSDNHQRLHDQFVHIPALRVEVSVECGNVIFPLANEDASVFIVHQWNMSRLDSKNQVWAGRDGSFLLPANAFPMHSAVEQGPNVRIGVCMKGADTPSTEGVAGVPDLLKTECVIYGNLSMSIADLMLKSGVPMTEPVVVHASSSDETGYSFRLKIMPHAIDASVHYSQANMRFVHGIAAAHMPMTTISAALMSCGEIRKKALVGQMQMRGVSVEHASKFYMQLPMGSIFDIHVDDPGKKALVDMPQWHAMNERSAILLAESHAPKLTEAAMKWISWECADHGVHMDSGSVSAHISELATSVEGREHIAASFKKSVMRANEDGFRYTSDSEVRGFRVRNTMHGVKLEARFSSTGEKQNGHGLDALTCDNHMQRACTLYRERMMATHDKDIRELDSLSEEIGVTEYTTALDTLNSKFMRCMSEANIASSMHGFMADCEDACASQVAVMQAPANIPHDRLPVIVGEILGSGVYPACAQAMARPVTQLLQIIRVHNLMSTVERGLCFAHGANLAEMKLAATTQTPPAVDGIEAKFNETIKNVNAGILGGHACAFSVDKHETAETLGPLHAARHMNSVMAHEGTNPIEFMPSEQVVFFDSHTTSPELEAKFKVINGNMPVTTAKSIISELSSHSVSNIINCDANAVTYTSSHSPFYHTLISSDGSYVYSKQNGVMLPTARISLLNDPSIEVFLIEGKLLDSVTIGDKQVSESNLLDMVVRASTCLAPTYQRIMERQQLAGLRMSTASDGMPPLHHSSMTRVICRTPVLQTPGIKTDSCHVNEQNARVSVVKAIHPGALVGSCNSHTFNVFLPSV